MKRSRLAILPVVLLAAAGCDGGGDGLTDDQQAAADAVLDRDCVEDKAKDLSDDDAKAIAEAAPGGSADLSPERARLTLSLASCINSTALVEQFIIGMEESGHELDAQCVREGLENFHMGEIDVVLRVAAACDGLTADQQAAADQFLSQDTEALFDQDCVEDKAKDLSDEDAKAIAESGPDESPRLSAEGEALTLELLDCVDSDALVDQFIIGMEESGQDFDEECVREELEDFDMSEIAVAGAEGGDIPEGLLSSLIDCFDFELGS